VSLYENMFHLAQSQDGDGGSRRSLDDLQVSGLRNQDIKEEKHFEEKAFGVGCTECPMLMRHPSGDVQ